MSRELKPCGTHAAYLRHKRRGEPACEACLAANAERSRTHRPSKPRYTDRARERDKARQRARFRLAREFPGRYRELCNEEFRNLGESS